MKECGHTGLRETDIYFPSTNQIIIDGRTKDRNHIHTEYSGEQSALVRGSLVWTDGQTAVQTRDSGHVSAV